MIVSKAHRPRARSATKDQELTAPARRSRSVVREFLKSAQAARPRRHKDQELTAAARRSRSVVREILEREQLL